MRYENKKCIHINYNSQVNDFTTNEITWADSINSGKYITNKNMEEKDKKDGWMQPKKDITEYFVYHF